MNAILARPAIYIYIYICICINKNMSIVSVAAGDDAADELTRRLVLVPRKYLVFVVLIRCNTCWFGGWGLAVVGGDPIGNGLCQQFRPRAHLVEFKAIPYRTPSTKTFVFKAGIAIHDLLFLSSTLFGGTVASSLPRLTGCEDRDTFALPPLYRTTTPSSNIHQGKAVGKEKEGKKRRKKKNGELSR